jgi:S-adenosylmethionine decarboxylase proenzyme
LILPASQRLPSHFTGLSENQGQGVHLIGEWYQCDSASAVLGTAVALRRVCLREARAAGLQIVGAVFHQFDPQGATGTVLLAESHLAIHTWPEANFVTIDVYVCNYVFDNTEKAHRLYNAMKKLCTPMRENFSEVVRGIRYGGISP